MEQEINKNFPAFILNINNKGYILKLGLMEKYEIFPYPYSIEGKPEVEVFFSYIDYKKRLKYNK